MVVSRVHTPRARRYAWCVPPTWTAPRDHDVRWFGVGGSRALDRRAARRRQVRRGDCAPLPRPSRQGEHSSSAPAPYAGPRDSTTPRPRLAVPRPSRDLRAPVSSRRSIVSGVDESVVISDDPVVVATELRTPEVPCRRPRLKSPTTRSSSAATRCSPSTARSSASPSAHGPRSARWRAMRGRSGVLHTGHCVRIGEREVSDDAATTVHFADLDDAEIDAYVATGEPLHVAGAFTVDGLGGAFVERDRGRSPQRRRAVAPAPAHDAGRTRRPVDRSVAVTVT